MTREAIAKKHTLVCADAGSHREEASLFAVLKRGATAKKHTLICADAGSHREEAYFLGSTQT